MFHCKRLFVGLLIFTITVPQPLRPANGCCPAFPHGHPIQIASQRILIAWDPQTKIEHFVREAGFRNPGRNAPVVEGNRELADDFGFLVPSPTQPSVEAANGEVFQRLEEKTQPRIEYRDQWQVAPIAALLLPFLLLQSHSRMVPIASPAAVEKSVEVLETKQVAGYDVSVLKASDANALSQWLGEHGYDSRPDLTTWAEPYVAQGWIITAFKYARDAEQVEAGAVRMSFTTERPIFPYRVPVDQIADSGRGNLLRTYVIGPGRATGTLGAGSTATPWNQAKVRYAMPLNSLESELLLAGAIPDGSGTISGWLTAFNDPTWPSGTEDLWFDFDAKAQPFQEVRVVVTKRNFFLPLDLLTLCSVGLVLVVRRKWLRPGVRASN